MGHRANYVIVEDGKQEVYFANWGALTLAYDIFFGPETTAAFMRTHLSVEYLLDDVFCEGVALLDFDNKKLLFCGWWVINDPIVVQCYIQILAYGYPEWVIQNAAEGIIDVCRYLGRDIDDVIAEKYVDDEDELGEYVCIRENLTEEKAVALIEEKLLMAPARSVGLESFLNQFQQQVGSLLPHAQYSARVSDSAETRKEIIQRVILEYRTLKHMN